MAGEGAGVVGGEVGGEREFRSAAGGGLHLHEEGDRAFAELGASEGIEHGRLRLPDDPAPAATPGPIAREELDELAVVAAWLEREVVAGRARPLD